MQTLLEAIFLHELLVGAERHDLFLLRRGGRHCISRVALLDEDVTILERLHFQNLCNLSSIMNAHAALRSDRLERVVGLGEARLIHILVLLRQRHEVVHDALGLCELQLIHVLHNLPKCLAPEPSGEEFVHASEYGAHHIPIIEHLMCELGSSESTILLKAQASEWRKALHEASGAKVEYESQQAS